MYPIKSLKKQGYGRFEAIKKTPTSIDDKDRRILRSLHQMKKLEFSNDKDRRILRSLHQMKKLEFSLVTQ